MDETKKVDPATGLPVEEVAAPAPADDAAAPAEAA